MPQRNGDSAVHGWYQTVLGFTDGLVAKLLREFSLRPGQLVLDPFCGSGTTLVECMKAGIEAVGVDANPSACFSARVKTGWRLNPKRLMALAAEAADRSADGPLTHRSCAADPTYQYIVGSGMLKRGWISPKPLARAVALKNAISALATTRSYRDALTLALVSEVVRSASNVKFGPELYCGPAKRDANVAGGFLERVRLMAADLGAARPAAPRAAVVSGDSRRPEVLAAACGGRKVSAVICSPPYPAEHDYTRNARLELAFLEQVTDARSVRAIKEQMVRCHTKGIYVGDSDGELVADNARVRRLASRLAARAAGKGHGFARLYARTVCEYFGGMKRHLASLKPLLAEDALCAYVVGDQSSYLRVHIPTAKVLAEVAEDLGYETLAIRHWRSRWSTTRSKTVSENILVLANRAT